MRERVQTRREIVAVDEASGYAAVVRVGPYHFVAASDGVDMAAGETGDDRVWDPEAQVRSSYERICARLDACGLPPGAVVRLEHFVRSQEWLPLRLSLWHDYFGGGATGGGAESKMRGVNMISTIAIALDASAPREVLCPAQTGPYEGWLGAQADWVQRAYRTEVAMAGFRPPKVVRAASLGFGIGVTGIGPSLSPETDSGALTAADWLRRAYDEAGEQLVRAGLGLDHLIRSDACVSDIAAVEAMTVSRSSPAGRFIAHPHGQPMGGLLDVDMQTIVAIDPNAKRILANEEGVVEAICVDELLFTAVCSGLPDPHTATSRRDSFDDKEAQLARACADIVRILETHRARVQDLARLDVYVSDVNFARDVHRLLGRELGTDLPVVNVVGAEVARSADVELLGIAMAPRDTVRAVVSDR